MVPTCPKCFGMLITEGSPDPETGLYVQMIRCLNCGFHDDPVMAANRLSRQPTGATLGHRGRVVVQPVACRVAL